MRFVRSIGTCLLIAAASLGLVAATPGQADAYHYRWYGGHHYPYYWNNYSYGPYYNNYSSRPYPNNYSSHPYTNNWYGAYGGYYNSNPYYAWSRTYPWRWYW